MALSCFAAIGKKKVTQVSCELCCISFATVLDKGGDHNNVPFVSFRLDRDW